MTQPLTKTAVPLLDLKRIHDPIEAELKSTFERVLHNNAYIMGHEVSQFESACADYLEVKHAIGVSSGTDALLLALMALNIQAGDEVICPTYTFFATAGCIWRLGAKPVFVDIDPQSYNLDVSTVEALITPKTKAIIPVHLFGQSADLEPLLQLGKKYNLPIIEDAAQAIGAKYKEKRVGSIGDFGCFSFFPAKNLGGFGDGGLLTTNDDELAEKAKILRTHGSKPKYHHHFVGGNFRLDALQAALLGVKLPLNESYSQQRNENATFYHEALQDLPLDLPHPTNAEYRHVYNQYVIRLSSESQREALKEVLKSEQIGFAVYYPIPLHLQACFSELGYKEGDLPHSELAAKTTLAIPVFPGLKPIEREQVSRTITSFIQGLTK